MVLKATVQKSIAKLWTVISNQMIKYQLPHTRSDQISGNKYNIYLYGKLSAKLLAPAANKKIEFVFTKTRRLIRFLISIVSNVTIQQNSKQTLP